MSFTVLSALAKVPRDGFSSSSFHILHLNMSTKRPRSSACVCFHRNTRSHARGGDFLLSSQKTVFFCLCLKKDVEAPLFTVMSS